MISPITVVLYRVADCPACDRVEADLRSLQDQIPHQLALVDVAADAALRAEYPQVPVVAVGPYRLKQPFTRQELVVALGAARDRAASLENVGDERYDRRMAKGHTVTETDRLSRWITRWWLVFVNLFLLIYVGLPFLAPVLAKSGAAWPARAIYTIYSPLCHQLSFRSFFLFGAQPVYPLELAQLEDYATYEDTIGGGEVDLTEARRFIGNDAVGYKVALCERDVAIWGTLLLVSVLFMVTGRRFRGIPFWAYVLLGVVPMGLDGTSQLPAMLQGFFDWFPARESTPTLRLLTGGLFGSLTGIYLFPLIEESMRETRAMLSSKAQVVSQIHRKE